MPHHHQATMGKIEAWIWLSIQMATEIYTATIVLLMYRDNKDPAWIVYTVTTPIRVGYWLAFSIRMNPYLFLFICF